MTVQAGEVLAGKYRIDKVLGYGGMGVVVAAHHVDLDERVAIKFMLEHTLGNAEAVARFAREARAAVKIKSEHVARVSDVGKLANGAPYMVMEYLDGGDLSAWLKQHGRLPIEQAVEFVLQACEALAEAHALGIVHRDLKPANMFVIRRPDGTLCVKVLDFGISKMGGLGSSGPELGMTKTSTVMGSPLYMSPEQMRSTRAADARSDIWALGVILYELVTGLVPFKADALTELVLKIATDQPQPLRDHVPDAPPALVAAILRCLEKDPARRFRTVGELAVALAEFSPRRAKHSIERISGVLQAAGLSDSALVLPPSSALGAEHGAGTAAAWGQTAPSASNGARAALAVLGLFGLVAIAGAALFLYKPHESRAASAATPSANAAAPATTAELPRGPAAEPTATVAATAEPPPAALEVSPALSPAPAAAQSAPTDASRAASPRVRPRDPGTKAPAPESKPAAEPKAAAAAKPNCNPNFYLDAQGEKHFKPECFK